MARKIALPAAAAPQRPFLGLNHRADSSIIGCRGQLHLKKYIDLAELLGWFFVSPGGFFITLFFHL
jgi:hypothetical protein